MVVDLNESMALSRIHKMVGMSAASMVALLVVVLAVAMVDQLAALSAALMVVMRAYGLVVQ